MVEKIGSRQQQILKLLLAHKSGLSIDETAATLAISRNAVQQHFAALERDGYIQPGELSKTAGRPVRRYVLTAAGLHCFPKQYAWFSELLLADLKQQMGAEKFQQYLHNLGISLSQTLMAKFTGKDLPERARQLVEVMEQLGFQATIKLEAEHAGVSIEACNCIYHDLAQKHDEVCAFDRALLAALLDQEIEQPQCMAKGDNICQFKIIAAGQDKTLTSIT